MRMSRLFLQTLRDAPSEARSPGYQFLMRAGYLRGLGGGAHAFLPLGLKTRRRLEALATSRLRALGAQELDLPLVQIAELGAANRTMYGKGGAIAFRDHGQRPMMLEINSEPAMLGAAATVIQSYRQLPLLLYRTWQRFADQPLETGELGGAREGLVLDVTGLHADRAGMASTGEEIQAAFAGVLAEAGIATHRAIAAEGSNGTPAAMRWLTPQDAGRPFVRCAGCGYTAEQEVARSAMAGLAAEEALPREDVETPDCKTIADLCRFLNITEARTAKAVFLVAGFPDGRDRFVFAIVRGDTALNEAKLKRVLGADTVGFATEAEIRQAGAEPGYGSPVGLDGVMVVADELAVRSPNLVAGANRPGYHSLNVNHGRDYTATTVADIRLATAGSGCPNCGQPLALEYGGEVAFLREAGDALTRAAGATYLDRDGRAQPLLVGSYRLYLDRVLAAAAEAHHDAHGLRWPAALAPFDVYVMTVGKSSPEVEAAAQAVHDSLQDEGFAVLMDDRDERAGVKFNDADLLGIPLRIAVGDRGLRAGTVEVKSRAGDDVLNLPLEGLTGALRAL